MSTTRIDTNTQLISSESVAFIRPITLKVGCTLMKPNTRMYPFFDGTDVSRYFTQIGSVIGDPLVTDNSGRLSATFDVPGMTFTTGNKKLLLQERSVLGSSILGATDGFATKEFLSSGILQKFQTTTTTTNTIVVEQVVRVNVPVLPCNAPGGTRADPLAQSFFTHGVAGGCVITSVDIFFNTKDEAQPVWIELRHMVNGFPSEELISTHSTKSLVPSEVNISSDASVPTNFRFDKLIKLEPDRDYCFVLQSRSNKYNVWTSRLAEASIETGNVVFDQPYNGSLFKSENNYTWTPEQTEDIKFVLYKAEFNTNVDAVLNFNLSPSPITIQSSTFQTFETSNYVYGTFPFKHALDLNSKIAISCDIGGVYNGITSAQLTGDHVVFDIVDEYTVGFIVAGAVATSTGKIFTGGLVKDIQVDNGGIGYDPLNPPVLTITGVGTGAAASMKIADGKIVDITVTSQGSGYTTPPVITFVGVVGSGATATSLIDCKFTVNTNRVYHAINPAISYAAPSGTTLETELKTTLCAFENGNVVSYSDGKTYSIDLQKLNKFDNNLMLASRFNENLNMSNRPAASINMLMSTTNKNISPIIDLSTSSVLFNANTINNQRNNESITSNNQLGFVTGLTLVSGGSGYVVTPTIVIYGSGTGATATCTMAGGIVTGVTLVTGGSGYTSPPVLAFVGTCTSAANATCTISDYNSELSVVSGSGLARYITKQQSLDTLSGGINIVVSAYSNNDSSFDIYIRSSLSSSGVVHTTTPWKILNCDSTRNKSSAVGQFIDYQFYLNDIPEFDVYSLKFVLKSLTPYDPPVIDNYRSIILAT